MKKITSIISIILILSSLTTKAQDVAGKTFISQDLVLQGKKGLCENNICAVFRFEDIDSVSIEWWYNVTCIGYNKYEEKIFIHSNKYKYTHSKEKITIKEQFNFDELDFKNLKGIYNFNEGRGMEGKPAVEFSMYAINYDDWKRQIVNQNETAKLLEGTWVDKNGIEITFKNGYSNKIGLDGVTQPDKAVATWYEYKLEEKNTLNNMDWLGVYYCSNTNYYLGLQPVNPAVNSINCPDEIIKRYYHYIKISKDELIIYGTKVTPHPKDLEEKGETKTYIRKK